MALLALIGTLGLCLDLARLYVVKNELQAYADAAALAGAEDLDGSPEGIRHAAERASSYPNRWNFQTADVEGIAVTFAAGPEGPFVSEPPAAETRCLRVKARATMSAYFLTGMSRRQAVDAVATSGQFPVREFDWGLIPYSAAAPEPRDPNFGHRAGEGYPLQLLDLGERPGGHALDFLREAILSGAQSHPLAAGDRAVSSAGDWETEAAAFAERLEQDSDTEAQTYQEYAARDLGNGRRVLVAAVHDPATRVVLGFAGFFLPRDACGEQAGAGCRAEYIGAVLLPGRKA
ncbi:MAG: pilus assembly protein TadG-related protein, partial [Candidatus Rokuibacteriota bacterium]